MKTSSILRVLPFLLLAALAVTALADDPPKFELEGHRLKLPAPFVFDGEKLDVAASERAIEHVTSYLDAKTSISTLRIEVHADGSGSADEALALTKKRALAVARALVAKGVDCKRLVAVGFGGSKPVAPNDTPENKSANRRVECWNAALRGHAIGGMPLDGGGALAGDPCEK